MDNIDPFDALFTLILLHQRLAKECQMAEMFSNEHCATIILLSDKWLHLLTQLHIDGYTLLCLAAKYEKMKIMKFLLTECKAEIAQSNRYGGFHPLQCAKSFEVVSFLIENGADVNFTVNKGLTPLHMACQNPELKMVRYLVEHGANLESVTDNGDTPLLHACHFERFEIVRYLVEQGADVLKQKKSGRTCLHEAVNDYETCTILLKCGADVNIPDRDCNTPLHMAIKSGKYMLFKLFMEHQGDPTLRNSSGEDALHVSCIRYKRKVAEHLLKHGEYSPVRRAEAYELLGCGMLMKYKTPNFSKGGMSIPKYWKTALEIKQKNMEEFSENNNKVIDKRSMRQSIYQNVTELLTEQDLDNLDSDPIPVCVHTLLILERMLGPDHFLIVSTAHIITQYFYKKKQYQMCVDLLFHLIRLKTFKRSVTVKAVHLEVGILSDIFLKTCSFGLYLPSNFVPRFHDVLKLTEVMASLLTVVHVNMEKFLSRIIRLLDMLIQMPKRDCELYAMTSLVKKMVKWNIHDESKDTLLHRATMGLTELRRTDFGYEGRYTEGSSYPLVVDLLLDCGHEVNVENRFGETPVHNARLSAVIRSFIAHEARDHTNANLVIQSSLPEIPKISTSVQLLSLQCLAALTIVEHFVPYENAPNVIIQFIEYHK